MVSPETSRSEARFGILVQNDPRGPISSQIGAIWTHVVTISRSLSGHHGCDGHGDKGPPFSAPKQVPHAVVCIPRQPWVVLQALEAPADMAVGKWHWDSEGETKIRNAGPGDRPFRHRIRIPR